MSLAETTVYEGSTPRRRTLRFELDARGIKVLDPKVARAHMRKTSHESRHGIYKLLWPFLTAFTHFATWVNLSRHSGYVALSLLVAMVILAIAAFVGSVPHTGMLAGAIVLFMVSAFGALALFFTFADPRSRHFNADFAGGASIWFREQFYEVDYSTLLGYGVPQKLIERTLRARGIPGIKVNRLRFGVDPFIELSWKNGLFTERHIIGGYKTDDNFIDNF